MTAARDEDFEDLRPLLFSIAYRLLGGVAEAEDAVQETWLRYRTTTTKPNSLKAFLTAIVTRVSIDVLRSARVRREAYVGQWLPEPLLTDVDPAPYRDPERAAELADSLSMAALLVLERLSPEQRAVFVLHDVFGYPFGEIAGIVGKSESTCRQLASRARRHMDEGRPRFEADRRERDELAARFFARSPSATSTGCATYWPPMSRCTATAVARRPSGVASWSASTTWPGCSRALARASVGSASRSSRTR